MSSPVMSSKRPYEESEAEINGRVKLAKIENESSESDLSGIIFRLLCPSSKAGSLFETDGSTILRICQETGVDIKVEDAVFGCDERVLVILNPKIDVKPTANVGKEDNTNSDMASEGHDQMILEKTNDDNEPVKHDEGKEPRTSDEDKESGKQDGNKEPGKHDENGDLGKLGDDKEPGSVGTLKAEKNDSSAKKALLLIFEKMIESRTETDEGNDGMDEICKFTFRLLIFSSQLGCLLGNDDCVIMRLSSETGAQIQILPRDSLPSCVLSADELVQITGEISAVRRALLSVAQLLLENPPLGHETTSAISAGSTFGQSPRTEVQPRVSHPLPTQAALFAAGRHEGVDVRYSVHSRDPKYQEGGIPGRTRMRPNEDVLTFRLLCPEDKVGGVIGKGGTIVKSLQNETGCDINVIDGASAGEERIIAISGPMHPDDRISPVQDAVLRVQARIFRALPESKEKSVTARLLVSSSQIGCLLGKGGSIIAEMRKSSGAHIRILGKDQVPKCASEDEEVIQINGDLECIQEALLQITYRLLQRFFRDTYPSMNYPSNSGFRDNRPFPPYGRREMSPQQMYSNYGPSHGGFYPHDDHSPFMQNIHRLGVSPNILERNPASAPWDTQGRVDSGGQMGFPDYAGGPPRRIQGFVGGAQPPIITNTTVEVVVPRSVVPAIYGEDGGCLKQIRQISDAKITITDSKPGATETLIIISGTPEQYHAAQSLIQAFVMSEKESS